MNIYFMINWFFLCSLLGYLLECVVLTCENRTPVINRGFGHGPFCIIYGFGALGANLLLSPLANDTLKLYFAAMTMATFMELVTARAMIRLFGSFWWDYSKRNLTTKASSVWRAVWHGDFWGLSIFGSSTVFFFI